MLSMYLKAAVTKPAAVTEDTELYLPETLKEEVTLEGIETALEEAESIDEKLGGLYVAALDTKCPLTKSEAQLFHAILNQSIQPLDLQVSMESIFSTKGEQYEISMEGIEITFSGIWKFVKRATMLLVDTAMSFFGRRLTFVGRAYQQSKRLREKYAKLELTNMEELSKIEHKFPNASNYLVDSFKDRSSAEVLTPAAIQDLLTALATSLNPKEYRDSIEGLVSILRGFKGTSVGDIENTFKVARESVIQTVKEYASLTEKTSTGNEVLYKSQRFPGYMHFEMRYYPENSYKAPTIKLVSETSIFKGGIVDTPITPTLAHLYADSVEKAMDTILKLRHDYEEVRKFKKTADEAVKGLKKLEEDGEADARIADIYRSIPSYVNLYNKALKVRSDMVYNYGLGMLAMINGSQQYWKVKVND